MPINDEVRFTWIGHGTWLARSARGKQLLLDAWVTTNPVAPERLKKIDSLDVMLITHGHFDHTADAVEIGKATHAKLIGIPETVGVLTGLGFPGSDNIGMNKGGTIDIDGIKITMVDARHSGGIEAGEQKLYGGDPAGYVIEFENGFTIYFAGDTDVFMDMKLFGELHRLDAAFLPIGGHYTMDPKRAAKAVELLGVKTVVPMHFATFPMLTGRPSQLQELVGPGVKVLDIQPGAEV